MYVRNFVTVELEFDVGLFEGVNFGGLFFMNIIRKVIKRNLIIVRYRIFFRIFLFLSYKKKYVIINIKYFGNKYVLVYIFKMLIL